MIIRKPDMKVSVTDSCHGGVGELVCTELLGNYEKRDAGMKYVHDDTLAPGASIGDHTHEGDEEIYIILDGRGTMLVDGSSEDVSAGDVCITRSGHRHSLTNTGSAHMRLLVVGTALGGR